MTKDISKIARSGTDIATTPVNPEGKGQVGFLLDWEYSTPRGVVVKPRPQLMADYFTSLLVLSASFKFKPAFETNYYLYAEGDGWGLSLIAPEEWRRAAKREAYVGRCVLHNDSTWSIDPSDNVAEQGLVSDALRRFYDGFVEQLSTAEQLENLLPVYAGKLPYWQRLFASALSRSMKASLTKGEQMGVAARDWLSVMPGDASQLLLRAEQETG